MLFFKLILKKVVCKISKLMLNAKYALKTNKLFGLNFVAHNEQFVSLTVTPFFK